MTTTKYFLYDEAGPYVIKDPASVLDYGENWAAWLDGDVIVAATWDIGEGLTKITETHDDTTATVWLSGGPAGETVMATCHIQTQAGREDERSFRLKIRER